MYMGGWEGGKMGGVGVFERVAVLSESDSFHHPATGVGTHASSFASMVDGCARVGSQEHSERRRGAQGGKPEKGGFVKGASAMRIA